MHQLKALTGKRIALETDDDAFDGVVESVTREFVTLTDAVVISGPNPVQIDGFILIPLSRIKHIRVSK